MHPEAEDPTEGVARVLETIHRRYGYDFRGYRPASIQRRLLAGLAQSGLRTLEALEHRLSSDPAFFAQLLEGLTVQVSALFRDPSFYRTLRERLLPVLETYPLPRIWIAGCASGEEVYSLAILLQEAGLYERAQLYATDLSGQAVDTARRGIYSKQNLASFSESYRASNGQGDPGQYVTEGHGRLAMQEHLGRKILFFQHDLVSDHVFAEMQVILCRNVLIYFDDALRQKVLEKFSKSLCPRGFLCLGSSEQLSDTHERHGFVDFAPEVRIYRHDG